MPLILPYKDKYPNIAQDAFIAENAVIIGDVTIASEASIWYNVVVRGDVAPIIIGAGTNIQDGSVIHVNRKNGPCIIGSRVTVGHMALLHACVVADKAFIGMGAKILDYAKVESGAMVAAGALIAPRKIVPTGEVWSGVPARFMRQITTEEADYIEISATNYIHLAREYRHITP